MEDEIVFIKFGTDRDKTKRNRFILASILSSTKDQISDAMPMDMKQGSSYVDDKMINALLNITPDYLIEELLIGCSIQIRHFMSSNRITLTGLKEDS